MICNLGHPMSLRQSVCARWSLHVRHASFICVTWHINMCDMTRSYVWHDTSICATWLNHMCDMSHSYLRHDLSTCATWLIHMCDMTRLRVWHDSIKYASWFIHMYDMTHSYVCHDKLRVTRLIYVWSHLLSNQTWWLIHKSHVLPCQKSSFVMSNVIFCRSSCSTW